MKKIVFLGFLVILGFSFSNSVIAAEIDNPIPGAKTLVDVITKLTDVIVKIIAAASVLMVVISGFYFVTSGGKPEKVEIAKTMLLYAIIGLLVGGLSYSIVTIIVKAVA